MSDFVYDGIEYENLKQGMYSLGLEDYYDRSTDYYNKYKDFIKTVNTFKNIQRLENKYSIKIGMQSYENGYPIEIENGVLKDDNDLAKYVDYPLNRARRERQEYAKDKDGRVDLVPLVERLKGTPYPKGQKRFRKTKDGFYPQEYNGVIFVSNIMVSEYTGYAKSLIEDRRREGKTLEEIIEEPKSVPESELAKSPEQVKETLDLYVPKKDSKRVYKNIKITGTIAKEACDFYPQEYDGRVFYGDTAVSLYLKSLGIDMPWATVAFRRVSWWALERIIETSTQNVVDFYPQEYDSVIFECDNDVVDYIEKNKGYRVSRTVVWARRTKGWSIEEIINIPLFENREFTAQEGVLTDIFPFKRFGREFETVEDLSKYTGISRLKMVSKVNSCKFIQSLFVGMEGSLSKRRPPRVLGKEKEVLFGKYIYNSIEDLAERIRINIKSVKNLKKSWGLDLAVSRVFIFDRLEFYGGCVTPDLEIMNREMKLDNLIYYECLLNGNLEYLNEIEIMEHRMSYIEVAGSVLGYYNNGIYETNVGVCEFYNMPEEHFNILKNENPDKSLHDIVLLSMGEFYEDYGSFSLYGVRFSSQWDCISKVGLDRRTFSKILQSTKDSTNKDIGYSMFKYYDYIEDVCGIRVTNDIRILFRETSKDSQGRVFYYCELNGEKAIFTSKDLILMKVEAYKKIEKSKGKLGVRRKQN